MIYLQIDGIIPIIPKHLATRVFGHNVVSNSCKKKKKLVLNTKKLHMEWVQHKIFFNVCQ